MIALIVLIGAGLYTLFTPAGLVENFTSLAWTNSKFMPGPIVIAMYQGMRLIRNQLRNHLVIIYIPNPSHHLYPKWPIGRLNVFTIDLRG